MDIKPSVVLLFEKYKVDCVITETLELAEKLKKIKFLRFIKRDGRYSLFMVDKKTLNKELAAEKQKEMAKFKSIPSRRRIIIGKSQLDSMFRIRKYRYMQEPTKPGWYKIRKSPAIVIMRPPGINPYEYSIIEIMLSAKSETDNVSRAQIYWETDEEQFMDEKKTFRYKVISDGKKRVYRLDLSDNYQWLHYGKITKLRIDLLYGKRNIFEISLLPTESK
ncbi:hypothetical protein J7M23_08705 [Candidatus Sumerlaeota bacterium]|nr:hypothetical protein [Candidatus Sumerlaeota bacterium]